MKLLLIFATILALSLAEEKKTKEVIEDSEAEESASIELLKEGADLKAAASSYPAYVPPSQRPPHWNQPTYIPPQGGVKPIQPINTSQGNPPSNVQSDYYPDHHHHPTYPPWSTPIYHPPKTTTPASVITNEQYFGENGHYKYEYQISDGTHVGEEGYFTDPKGTEESIVKKGWYSYVGADGKTYTVTYWADKTGFHAYGDHLPTPPPVPAAIQAALDKEKEADKYKPQHDYPTQTSPPVYYPTPAPTYKPPNPTYAPPQPTFQPTPAPTYKPSYPSYNPQQTYYPPQQTYYPPQQNYYPPQQNYYPPQQNDYPQQPTKET